MIETRSIDYVPLAERRGKVWHLWPVWFSGDAHLATLAVGVLGISLGGNLIWTAIAVTCGCALGTFFMAFHSAQGPQLGLAQMIQSRPQFGYVGALLVWFVALVAYIGYNSFNQVLAVQAVHQLAPAANLPAAGVSIAFALLALGLAIVGYDWIHKAQRWLAYLLLVLLTLFTIGGLFNVAIPPEHWDLRQFRSLPFLTQLFAAAAYQLSWSIYVSDYSRYLPRDVGVRASFWWTYLGAFIGGVWMMLIGSVAAALNPQVEVAEAMQRVADEVLPGFGKLLLAAGLLGLVSISALNFYGASLTMLSAADSIRRLKFNTGERLISLVVVAICSSTLALTSSGNFVQGFGNLLSILLYLLTPWTAINLVDFYFVRRGYYSIREIFNPHGLYGRWNWRGLGAYALGFLAMIPFFSTSSYQGAVARVMGGVDVAMLVGLPVAGVAYWMACRSLDVEADSLLAIAADRGVG